MKKILITGNSGYIGSHLTKMISNDSNCNIYGLDINQPLYSVDDHFLEDIRNETGLWAASKFEYDCVIHLAAKVSVGQSVSDPINYYLTNVFGTLNILKKVKSKRFVFASTGAAENLKSPYGISKRAMEQVIEQHCKENSIPFTIFRFYNVIGQDGIPPTNPDGLFYSLIKSRETGEFTLFGNDYNTRDGSCVRDYTHVNEICNAVTKAIDQSTDRIENLGHGVGTTVKEMIAIFKETNNCEFNVIAGPRREGDLETSVLDNPSRFMKKLYTINELLKVI